MLKKALWMMIPFMLIFLLGLILLMRPQYHVPIVEVMDTFTRQEKTGQRSAHRHTVDYATVKVELDGEEHKVTVHDNSWQPLKTGHSEEKERRRSKRAGLIIPLSYCYGILSPRKRQGNAAQKRNQHEQKRPCNAPPPLLPGEE